MKSADGLFCGFLFILGLVLCGASLRMGYGEITQPGSGFLPFWCGTLMALISLGLSLHSLWKKNHRKKEVAFREVDPIRPLIILGDMVLYGLLFKPFGFLLTSFLFQAILFRFIWHKSLVFVLLISLLIDSVFYFTLISISVPLPKGLLGF